MRAMAKRNESGQELIELAILLPLFLVVAFFGIEVMRLAICQRGCEDLAATIAQNATLEVCDTATSLKSKVMDRATSDGGTIESENSGGGVEYYIENGDVVVTDFERSSFQYRSSMGTVTAPRHRAKVSVTVHARVSWITPIAGLLEMLSNESLGVGTTLTSHAYTTRCDITGQGEW